MKISNSKKELARIIRENGGWRDGAEFSVSTCSGTIAFSRNKPEYTSKYGFTASGGFMGYRIELCSYLKNWHQTILSREEYFHLHPAPDADGWIEWNGGECPVEFGELIDVKYRDGHFQTECRARDRCDTDLYATTFWGNSGGSADIIAYRMHKPEQSEPKFCESVTRSIPEPETKPSIEQLAADYRNRKDYADRKQEEADAAKADAEAKLAELVAAGREIGLFLSVEITHVYSGKFYNAELGESPEYSETNNNSICEGCGKRLGQHYELASYCLSRTERERVGSLTL